MFCIGFVEVNKERFNVVELTIILVHNDYTYIHSIMKHGSSYRTIHVSGTCFGTPTFQYITELLGLFQFFNLLDGVAVMTLCLEVYHQTNEQSGNHTEEEEDEYALGESHLL